MLMLVSKGNSRAIEQGLLLDLVEGLFSPDQSMCCPAARLSPQIPNKTSQLKLNKSKKKRSKMTAQKRETLTTKQGLIKKHHLGWHPN